MNTKQSIATARAAADVLAFAARNEPQRIDWLAINRLAVTQVQTMSGVRDNAELLPAIRAEAGILRDELFALQRRACEAFEQAGGFYPTNAAA